MATQSERPRDPFGWCVGGLLAARGGWEVNGERRRTLTSEQPRSRTICVRTAAANTGKSSTPSKSGSQELPQHHKSPWAAALWLVLSRTEEQPVLFFIPPSPLIVCTVLCSGVCAPCAYKRQVNTAFMMPVLISYQ